MSKFLEIMSTVVPAFRASPSFDPTGAPNRYEVQVVRRCALAMLAWTQRTGSHESSVEWVKWLRAHRGALELASSTTRSTSVDPSATGATDALMDAFVAAVSENAPAAPSPLEKRLRWIASTMGLSEFDAELLKLLVRSAMNPALREIACVMSRSRTDDETNLDVAAVLSGRSSYVLRHRLERSRPLLQFGLVEDRNGGDFAPSKFVLKLARARAVDPAQLTRHLFGVSAKSRLREADFTHMDEAHRIATALVTAALERREQGVGILLYGPPGTGKTEYAKVLTASVGAHAVFIGETDDEDGEPSRSERIAHFAMTSALAGRTGRTVLVVDEADDIFTGVDEDDRASRAGSKVFMNRLVERCAAPTIWITNNPSRLGPAVMRRMAFAIRFPEPGRAVRRRMVSRIAAKRKIKLTKADLDRLEAAQAAPALIEAGLRAASLTKGGVPAALACTDSLLRALGRRGAEATVKSPVPFDPTLSAADCDLVALAERARVAFAAGNTALSFCFHGIPGTGKSAFARHLAERIGLEVIETRASDLLSKWVGGTEENIAAAFRDAAEQRAMLVIDEADSLLQDRCGAQRSWEITQVNEMLTWMERHPYPLVCTTNAIDALDRATLRRFLFKVEFVAMTCAQAREAFRRAFAVAPPPSLDRLDPLTPGDFAVVARKVMVMPEHDPDALVNLLAAEVDAKERGPKRRIGF